jgi:phenylacetate-CoA ligase
MKTCANSRDSGWSIVSGASTERSPFTEKMQAIGLTPDDITSIDDLKKLPLTDKQDLRDNYPFGTFAVPMSKIIRVHASSGTTGKQKVVGYTKEDIDLWSECIARSLAMTG